MKSELCAFFMLFYLLQKQSVPGDVVTVELDSTLAKEEVKLYSKMEEYRCSIDVPVYKYQKMMWQAYCQ